MWGFYFKSLVDSLPLFFKGLWITDAVSSLSLLLATILGFLLGVVRSTRMRPLKFALAAYVDLIRSTPSPVQIFIVFFILPEWGIHLRPLLRQC